MKTNYTILSVFACCICLSFSTITNAQLNRFDIDIFDESGEKIHGLVGGLTAPQFSEVDLNNDGTLDLFIFDRAGNVPLTFINEGTPNEVDYKYAPFYERFFPEMIDWAMLRDYNGDGIHDIFTYSDFPGIDGMLVYTGKYVNNIIQFERFDFTHILSSNLIPFPAGNGFTQLYITGQDYPAVDDIDRDGDLDILTFAVGGGHVYLFENQSVDLGFGQDSLIFTLADDCWGRFYESGIDEVISLSDNIDDCSNGLHGGGDDRHAGSTLLTLDVDEDDDLDLILGDISFDNLTLLTNGGSTSTAFMTDQIVFYPNNTVSADIAIFPASYYLDVNNDGIKDLLASPNNYRSGENLEVVWHYDNSGANNNPSFQFVERTFMVGDMIDLGNDANPTFVDYNADGLLDLVVGNGSFYVEGGGRQPRLYLFENIGTASNPSFELVDEDFLNMSDFESTSNYGLAPTFGDIDMDGDMDVLIGEVSGRFFFGENTAGAGNPINIPTIQFNYMGLDLGAFSTPQIIDLNRDGKMDIVAGEKVGRLVYFQNDGTATEPMFTPNITVNEAAANNIVTLGLVDTQFGSSVSGYATPFFVDFNGTYNLFAGSEQGYIYHYSNIDDNLDGTFTLENDTYGSIRPGFLSAPVVVDLDNDGRLEMFVGNVRGGITAYQTNFNTDGSPVSTVNIDDAKRIELFPNPANDFASVVIEGAYSDGRINVFNALGQLLQSDRLSSNRMDLNTSDWSAGIYLIQVELDSEVYVEKLIVR